jgi:hypothetical protein
MWVDEIRAKSVLIVVDVDFHLATFAFIRALFKLNVILVVSEVQEVVEPRENIIKALLLEEEISMGFVILLVHVNV